MDFVEWIVLSCTAPRSKVQRASERGTQNHRPKRQLSGASEFETLRRLGCESHCAHPS